jgi:hypothetical protein
MEELEKLTLPIVDKPRHAVQPENPRAPELDSLGWLDEQDLESASAPPENEMLTSSPFGSLACSLPGALEAGTPVEVIRRNSGQSAFSSLPSAPTLSSQGPSSTSR